MSSLDGSAAVMDDGEAMLKSDSAEEKYLSSLNFELKQESLFVSSDENWVEALSCLLCFL